MWTLIFRCKIKSTNQCKISMRKCDAIVVNQRMEHNNVLWKSSKTMNSSNTKNPFIEIRIRQKLNNCSSLSKKQHHETVWCDAEVRKLLNTVSPRSSNPLQFWTFSLSHRTHQQDFIEPHRFHKDVQQSDCRCTVGCGSRFRLDHGRGEGGGVQKLFCVCMCESRPNVFGVGKFKVHFNKSCLVVSHRACLPKGLSMAGAMLFVKK
jgi:hypothetical protein